MRCNRCKRPMKGTTAYDGACACGGLIEAGEGVMYRFKVRAQQGIVWLKVYGGPRKPVWIAYRPDEILDLMTELECYDDGTYDRAWYADDSYEQAWPIPVYKPCQCEHEMHGDNGCVMTRQREVKTMYGTFRMCLTCYERGHMQHEPVSTPLPEGFDGF